MMRGGVLVVDDNELNRDMLARRLARQGFGVALAASGAAALEALDRAPFDVVLLDIEMPRMSGLDVLRKLRERHSPSELAVIMVSGRQDSESIVAALELGANDYITKPIDFAVAVARLNAQVTRRRLDAVRQRTDPLTGLSTRPALLEWSATRDDADRPAAALCLNLDRFRAVNNGLGRLFGDRLLVALADRLQALMPARARVARTHADEFACLLHGASLSDAGACADALLDAVRQPVDLDGQRVVVTASVGVACGESAYAAESLIDRADTALYRAKTLSGNRWELFAPVLQSRAAARLELETELQDALAGRAFDLRYEPIVDLKTGAVAGVEALVRWQHPRRGEMLPAEFIPVAEETRSIVPLGRLVLRAACKQLHEWLQSRVVVDDFYVAVNVSPRQLDEPEFIEDVRGAMEAAGVDARAITLEITESALMENSDRMRLIFERFRALGVRIALDDFGTGYSSLSVLQNFPIDTLKIDRSFIQGLARAEGGEIVKAVLQLGQTLGMGIVAEGVEAPWQLGNLRHLGCDHAQGYVFGRPLTAAAAARAAQECFPMTP